MTIVLQTSVAVVWLLTMVGGYEEIKSLEDETSVGGMNLQLGG